MDPGECLRGLVGSTSETSTASLLDLVEQTICHQGRAEAALAQLPPDTHTIGALAILAWKCKSANHEDRGTADAVMQLLQVGDVTHLACTPIQAPACIDRSVIHVSPKAAICCQWLAKAVQAQQRPLQAVQPLLRVLRKVARPAGELSPAHAPFLRVCITSKQYDVAADVLEEPIFSAPSAAVEVLSEDVFEFFVNAAFVFAARRDMAKALHMIQLFFACPAKAALPVHTTGYKLALLLSLLVTGVRFTLPKYVPPAVHRTVRAEAAAYEEIADAYKTQDSSAFAGVCDQHRQTLEEDQLADLVQLCVESLLVRRVQKLTKTYIAVPLAGLASTLGMQSASEAESFVVQMIEQQELRGRIDQEQGMIRFQEGECSDSAQAQLESLKAKIDMVHSIGAQISELDADLRTDRAYLGALNTPDMGVLSASGQRSAPPRGNVPSTRSAAQAAHTLMQRMR